MRIRTHQIKNKNENKASNLTNVSSSAVFPLAFLTNANKLFMKSKTDLSADETPRYIPNPNASGTYSLETCMKEYKPIYDKKTLKMYMQLTANIVYKKTEVGASVNPG